MRSIALFLFMLCGLPFTISAFERDADDQAQRAPGQIAAAYDGDHHGGMMPDHTSGCCCSACESGKKTVF